MASTTAGISQELGELREQAFIKRYEGAIFSEEITKKALEALSKRVDSQGLGERMLLRIVVALGKYGDSFLKECCRAANPNVRGPVRRRKK